MTLKKTFTAALLALTGWLGAAQAQTLTPVDRPTYPNNPSVYVGPYDANWGSNPASQSIYQVIDTAKLGGYTNFIDNYLFTLDQTTSFSALINVVNATGYSVTGGQFLLRESTGAEQWAVPQQPTFSTGSSGAAWPIDLGPGLYQITVTGRNNGTVGGNYLMSVNFSTPAVPEPESLAMMLAGLGLLGATARRRKLG